MKLLRSAAALTCALAVASSLASCSSVLPDRSELAEPSTQADPSANPEKAPSAGRGSKVDWATEYAAVLDNVDSYDFNLPNPAGIKVEFTPYNQYNYALVEANGGGAPELLVSSAGHDPADGRYWRVLVFTVDNGKLEQSDVALTKGAAGAGGYRAVLAASQLGRGLYQTEGWSGEDSGETVWCELDGATPVVATKPAAVALSRPQPLQMDIEWPHIDDRTALEAGELTVSLQEPEGYEVDAPDVVVSGKVVEKTGAEISPDGTPNGEAPESKYYLLELSSPQEFTDYRGGGTPSTQTTEYVDLGKDELDGAHSRKSLEWEHLVGEHVELTVDPAFVHFQMDASMPTGALRVGTFRDAKVL